MDITKRRPAVVPETAPDQRHFSESYYDIAEESPRHAFNASTDVYRNGGFNTAAVRIRGTNFSARIELVPDQLRRLASDLLDAALDIEQFPAAVSTPPHAQLTGLDVTGNPLFFCVPEHFANGWRPPTGPSELKAAVLSGPQGSSKGKYAESIAQTLGLTIFDATVYGPWDGKFIKAGQLLVTDQEWMAGDIEVVA